MYDGVPKGVSKQSGLLVFRAKKTRRNSIVTKAPRETPTSCFYFGKPRTTETDATSHVLGRIVFDRVDCDSEEGTTETCRFGVVGLSNVLTRWSFIIFDKFPYLPDESCRFVIADARRERQRRKNCLTQERKAILYTRL
eukprot:scaffold2257_cov169-Amphora_coffeaeformis.AAC.8